MPKPRNPNNLAVELAANMGMQLLKYVAKNFPERLGEGPLPERQRRIGSLARGPLIEQVLARMPEEEVP